MPRRKRDWTPLQAGPDGWGPWERPRRKGFRLGCCDCSLVHEVDFRLVPTLNGGRAIELRMKRDNRATAALRREERRRGKPLAHER